MPCRPRQGGAQRTRGRWRTGPPPNRFLHPRGCYLNDADSPFFLADLADSMQPLAIMKALILLTLANATPLIAKNIFGNRLAHPLDGGIRFLDGQPLLGESKTIRGIALSLLVTSAFAPLLGLEWRIGILVGSLAMAGDLFSSFIKRRIRLPAGSRATGLDQVPESLFPLLACRNALSLTAVDIGVSVVAFLAGELVLSRLLYKYRLRDHPY